MKSSLWTRRHFVRTGSTMGLIGAIPPLFIRSRLGKNTRELQGLDPENNVAPIVDRNITRAIALQAVDAAKSAGADYVDVRMIRNISQSSGTDNGVADSETLTIGVRVLKDGAWGFASSGYWGLEEASTLGRSAVEQAQFNSHISSRKIHLGNYSLVEGHWSTPIKIDPFSIPIEERRDFWRAFDGLLPHRSAVREHGYLNRGALFGRRECVVANSEGSYFTRTFYEIEGEFFISVRDRTTRRSVAVSATGLSRSGAGWELLEEADLREQIPQLIERAEHLLTLGAKPVDVGRYEIVCDGGVMATMVNGTLGTASQIDRAIGHEANASGTSYLGPDPMDYLGSKLGSSSLSISGDRSLARGLATTKWDDEGVEPDTFDIVSNGVFVDYQTTREQAFWLSEWYKKRGQPIKSHGCARTDDATMLPLQFAPNLKMGAGKEDVGFEDMIADVGKGLAVVSGGVRMDFQSRSGVLMGTFREIVNGKLADIIVDAGVLFDSTQIWKSLNRIGGEKSRVVIPARESKGQPNQTTYHSVSAVSCTLKDQAVINVKRKA